MDIKLEISGKPVKDSPTSVYKQIPEDDLDEAATMQSKRVAKVKNDSSEKDGADERMLPEADVKISDDSKINAADVKFITNEKQNGDAKVDIGELKAQFVGLSKDELMKYANDPFWVRLRWFLFILFWLLWAAMLIGAILIIVAAPKCSPPEPRTWWEQGPLTELDADSTLDELKQLKQNGLQGVIVSWPEDVFTSLDVSPKFLTFLERAKNSEMNVIVDLKIGSSSKWFSEAENEDDDGKYVDYYIWAPPKGSEENGTVTPPNNWKSRQNLSSWKFSTKRKQFYLSPDETPQLNFSNPKLIDEFSKVLHRFLDAGAKGIRLTGAPYLLVDKNFKDERITNIVGFGLTDYGFYKHIYTEYLPELGIVLKPWHDIVKNKTEGGPFMLSENLKTLDVFKVNNSLIIDLPLQSRVFSSNKQLTAEQIDADVNSTFLFLENKYWPLWQHTTSAEASDIFNIVTLLLPGTTMLSKNSTISKELLNIRKSSSVMHGNTTRFVIANKTVYGYGRLTAGNPGYLVVFNPSPNRAVVDFPSEISLKSEEVTVQYFSDNYNEADIAVKKKTKANEVPVSAGSVLVLSYVPTS
ncbi:hypothetical protein FQR65_LT18022 [Abscondita terminalis]|nr:hypothetical protein FQR65_LT18022 [Abscondita terminalis]